jgi:mRNA-degrading endonuclease RelE of RelBE toxin-antitoxin system
MYQVVLRKRAEKELNDLEEKYKAKVVSALTILAEEPSLGKKLQGELAGLYSYRVWPLRIVYAIYKDHLAIHVFRIAHRQGVYK